MEKGISTLIGIIIIIAVVVAAFGGVFTYQYFVIKTQPVVQTDQIDQTAGWKTYTDAVNGITFQYPNKFNSDYIALHQKPFVIVNSKSGGSIDENGCLVTINDIPTDSGTPTIFTSGNLSFCISHSSSGAAGTFYDTYYYTTYEQGKYYTFEFVVSRVDCGVYGDAANAKFKACTNDENDYGFIVSKPIQQSVSTFKFTK